MAKTIIKEIIIMLLLCLAIILVLGVLLYEYVPSNKIIPEEVSYTTPQDIQEELSKTEDVEADNVILTYSIDAADLDNYERINTYVPGKPNPFSPYETSGEDTNQSGSSTGGNSSSGSNTSTGSNNSGSSNTSTSTGGSEYYPDTGTK